MSRQAVSGGRVIIIGGGPGDPELITLKGLKYLMAADVVVYDRLAPRSLLKYCKKGVELIYAGKEPGKHTMTQDEINELLVAKAREGKLVVRLKGGDPYVLGRGEEECAYVKSHGVPCEVVPGIPSFIAAAVYAGVPLTSRGLASSFAVVPGREAEGKETRVNIRLVAKAVDVIVVLMGASEALRILSEVEEVRGPNELVAVVINATLEGQRVITGTISEVKKMAARGEIRNPAVIIIGRTVSLREKLWKYS